jgi:antitoxin (DNA-binding transcriptional repressor) of toxin-antitoxin stability system
MLIISSREFREKQKSYLEKVDNGIEILIRRGKNKSYKIVPVTEDDTLMSKEDFFAKIDKAAQSVKEGKGIRQRDDESTEQFIERLLCTK